MTAQKSQAQQKLYFTAFGGTNYSTARSDENNFTNFEYNEISRTGDTSVFRKNYFQYSLQSSYTGKQGVSFGVKVHYRLSNFVTLSGGAGLSSFGFVRKNNLTYKLTHAEYVTVIYTKPPNGILFSIPGLDVSENRKFTNYYHYVTEEDIQVTALKIPLEAAFNLAKSKFDLRLGLVPVLLLNYKVTQNQTRDPENTLLQTDHSENKLNLTASIGIEFPIYKNWKGNISYDHYFHTVTQGKMIPSLTPRIYNLSLVYKLPKFTLHE